MSDEPPILGADASLTVGRINFGPPIRRSMSEARRIVFTLPVDAAQALRQAHDTLQQVAAAVNDWQAEELDAATAIALVRKALEPR